VYYGEVDKIEYDALFEQLRNLMISRFDQKKEQNYELRHLEGIKNDVYPRLLEKQASIFVIYANGRPISIRLNLMKGRLAFYLMSAYDPNYELFRVGKLDMWQNIHWLMENDYEKYDLLKGYGYIKDRWSDSKFDNNLVLFNGDDSLMGNFRFWFFYWKTKAPLALIGLGKRFGLDRVLRDWKQNKKSDNERNVFDISPLGSGEHATLPLGESVEFPTPDNELDREIIKLAYRHFHPVDGILVHKIEPGPQQYRIQLGEHAYLLKFKSNRGIG